MFEKWYPRPDFPYIQVGARPDGPKDVARALARRAHLQRCAIVERAAKEWLMKHVEWIRGATDEAVNEAIEALLAVELIGPYGGGVQCPGAGTSRLPAFSALGKGRRHASDAPAWDAAISAVYRAAVCRACAVPLFMKTEEEVRQYILSNLKVLVVQGQPRVFYKDTCVDIITADDFFCLSTLCRHMLLRGNYEQVKGAALWMEFYEGSRTEEEDDALADKLDRIEKEQAAESAEVTD